MNMDGTEIETRLELDKLQDFEGEVNLISKTCFLL